MNKVLAGFLAIITIGAGGYFIVKGNGVSAPADEAQTQMGATNDKSLSALVAAKEPVTCTFATTTAGGVVQGTVYVANGMVAGDFTAQAQSMTVDAHMIVRDNTNYIWTSLSKSGFKSTVTASTSVQSNGVDYNAQMPYTCQKWNVDSNKFILPTDITFTATQSSATPSTSAGASMGSYKGTAAQCAQCATLPGSGKAQCEAALHC